ncbi:MAG: TetR/AcrR family transcriptional regulator [Planctomycetota bacterium]|jgi:AcrR family transcriptional regulator|nr:TetR/AcrR family transcriptional regulator [Planctomycetota bacterium]
MAANNPFFETFDILGRRYPLPVAGIASETKRRILIDATVLFAKKGYSAVSMKDIAKSIGVKPASLYNHYPGKEALWDAVLEHAAGLYDLYFERLEKQLAEAGTFAEALEVIFREPRKMANAFTCYAFSLVRTEQFRNRKAGELFNRTFLKARLDCLAGLFDRYKLRDLDPEFDSRTAAALILHSVFLAIDAKVHQYLGREPAYDPSPMLEGVERFLRRAGEK